MTLYRTGKQPTQEDRYKGALYFGREIGLTGDL